MLKLILFLFIFFSASLNFTLGQNEVVTVTLADRFSGMDTLSITAPDAAAERLRNLLFNSLVKKNERYEFVGDLANDIKIDYQKLTITFNLRDGIRFHNGKELTSADAKYTVEALLEANGYKGSSFFDSKSLTKEPFIEKIPHILSIETPDKNTLILKVRRIDLINQILSNLVAIPIIPEGTIEQQNQNPIGTGAFKFLKFDQMNNIVELESHQQYWEGSPKINRLVVKTISDPASLLAELQGGRVDIVANPYNFSTENINLLQQNPKLQVIVSNGANIRYIGFNTKSKLIKNVKFRQAVAYAINRERIVKELPEGQAKIAHSILPETSWAYSGKIKYEYDPEKAKKLLKEMGYRRQKVIFKISAGNLYVLQYAQLIKNDLKDVGINLEIEVLELNSLLENLKQGNFQMTIAQWVGGNQDPIFLRDLFHSKESPDTKPGGRNRGRYSNMRVDKLLDEAINASNHEKAKYLYQTAQDIVAQAVPLMPLWYAPNIVIANKRIGNIQISDNGDWNFIKNLTLN